MRTFNLALAFLLELVMLVIYGYGGYHIASGHSVWRWILAISSPLIVIVVWALFLAPKATYRLNMPWLLFGEIVVFAGAAILLGITREISLAIWFTVIVAINLALATYWQQM